MKTSSRSFIASAMLAAILPGTAAAQSTADQPMTPEEEKAVREERTRRTNEVATDRWSDHAVLIFFERNDVSPPAPPSAAPAPSPAPAPKPSAAPAPAPDPAGAESILDEIPAADLPPPLILGSGGEDDSSPAALARQRRDAAAAKPSEPASTSASADAAPSAPSAEPPGALPPLFFPPGSQGALYLLNPDGSLGERVLFEAGPSSDAKLRVTDRTFWIEFNRGEFRVVPQSAPVAPDISGVPQSGLFGAYVGGVVVSGPFEGAISPDGRALVTALGPVSLHELSPGGDQRNGGPASWTFVGSAQRLGAGNTVLIANEPGAQKVTPLSGMTGASSVGSNPAIAADALRQFFDFDPRYAAGVFVGDMTGSGASPMTGREARSAGASPGISANSALADFFAFDPAYSGGVAVAVAELHPGVSILVGTQTLNAPLFSSAANSGASGAAGSSGPANPPSGNPIVNNTAGGSTGGNTLVVTTGGPTPGNSGTGGLIELPPPPLIVGTPQTTSPGGSSTVGTTGGTTTGSGGTTNVTSPAQILALGTQTNQQVGISTEHGMAMLAIPTAVTSGSANTLRVGDGSADDDFAGTVVQARTINPTVASITDVSGNIFAFIGGLPSSGANRAAHLVWGAPSAAFPASGTFTYNFVASTSPTYGNGATAPGTMSGSVVINFASLRAGVQMTVAMPDQIFTIQPRGGIGNIASGATTAGFSLSALRGGHGFSGQGPYTTSSVPATCGGGACMTSVEGRLLGTNAAFTSVLFRTELTNGNSVSGAALGQR